MEELKEILNIRSEEILNEMMSITEKVTFKKGEMILNMGDSQNYVYLILEGIVRSYYLDINGNDITKAFMKENDFCVGESLFEKEPSVQGFECLEDVTTLKFDSKKFKKIVLSDDVLIKTYITFLENNLIYKMKRESSFQIMSGTERYINFHREYSDIEKRVNQSYIASYLGIAPESLSRIKRTIKEEN